ncbi:hypothetical protein K450DRAFT_257052 [Umbelopsis ramanniana AG]|uniref:Uncharacterized protein n=1 Tax=Umbelopsis ramanniana AG TaxID=1314678 RepID=A0AAD5E4Y1_UMBRA|nr:uncharacterized protein K450DRAFT_257052 [Umbelopsis ramanniana AG]KAI8576386.1 hypothetical protein K450DRAFT_257052 [Umbelopsis ramanniana AG]
MVDESSGLKIIPEPAADGDTDDESHDKLAGSTDPSKPKITLQWLEQYELEDLNEFDIVNTVEQLAMASQIHSVMTDFLQQPSPPPSPPCNAVQTDDITMEELDTYTSVPIILRLIFIGEAPDEVKMNVLHKLGDINTLSMNTCSTMKTSEEESPRIPPSMSTQMSQHPLSVTETDCRWSAAPEAIIDYLLEKSGPLDAKKPPCLDTHAIDIIVYFIDTEASKLERSIKLLKHFNSMHTAVLPILGTHLDAEPSESCQAALQKEGIKFLVPKHDQTWSEQEINQAITEIWQMENLTQADPPCMQNLIMTALTTTTTMAFTPDKVTPSLDFSPPPKPKHVHILRCQAETDNIKALKSFMMLLLALFSIMTIWLGWGEDEENRPDRLSSKWLNMSLDTNVPYFQAKLNPMWTTLDPVDHTHYFVVELYDHAGQRLPSEIGQEEIVDAVIRKQTRVAGDVIEEYEVINVPHLERGIYGVEVGSPCYIDCVEEIRVELWLSEYDVQVDGSPVTLSKETCTNGRHGSATGTRATEPRVVLKQPSRSSQPRSSINPDGTGRGHILFTTKIKKIVPKTHLLQRWFRALDSFLTSVLDYFTKATLSSYRFLPQRGDATLRD